MTGHLLYGKYRWLEKKWKSDDKLLSDSFNQFIHLIFTLSNGKHLAFSDMRKFAKVVLFETGKRPAVKDLALLGPEPLDKNFTLENGILRLNLTPVAKNEIFMLKEKILTKLNSLGLQIKDIR